LLRGTPLLRFPALLEREYCKAHLLSVATQIKGWTLALLMICLLSTGYRLGTLGGFGANFETVLRLLALLPACLVLLAASWGGRVEERYSGVVLFASAIVAVSVSILIARSVAAGGEAALTFLTTNLLATFFLVGLLFFDALLVALLGVATFALACWQLDMPLERFAYDTLLVLAVTAVGAAIAFGVEQSSRRSFLERGALGDLAERDGLTGLRNRRAFDEQLQRVWQQSLRDRSGIAILMIDLDHFKSYNDFYGHQAGDACLCHVANLVQRFARRPLDIAARYGGEELAVVLYQVSREHALAVADQLRFTVEAARVEHRGAPTRGLVTVSVGVAWLEVALELTPEQTVQLADQALYAAKLAGRNEVRFMGRGEVLPFDRNLRRVPRGDTGPKPAA
jgi:diguanylate cyclase (GGDEF)-like protein